MKEVLDRMGYGEEISFEAGFSQQITID